MQLESLCEEDDDQLKNLRLMREGKAGKMVDLGNNQTSHWWWFDSHKSSRRSTWLQSTLAELDEKTKAMLKLIEEDADSFAQRAEMYYKKRPELISMVEEFYRAHRSLAERYDLIRNDTGTRLLTTLGSPFSSTKYQNEKIASAMDQTYDSYSETFDPEESAESEVDDPEQEEENHHLDSEIKEVKTTKAEEHETHDDEGTKNDDFSSGSSDTETTELREEIERLKIENKIQKDQLLQKDDEKREVIRQLSIAVEMLKVENLKLRKCISKESPKKWAPFEFGKLKGGFLGKIFNGAPKSRTSIVAL